MLRPIALLLGLTLLAAPALAAEPKKDSKTTSSTKKTTTTKKTTAKPATKSKTTTKTSSTKSAAKPKAAANDAYRPARTATLTSPSSNAVNDDYVPPPTTATGDRGLMAQAFVALDRGQTSQALVLADRLRDTVLGDAVRGEAYAAGASASPSEIYSFLARHPDWPQRSAIMANAEGQLTSEAPYEPMLKAYTPDSPPATTQGFNSWIATLRAYGREDEARTAIRARWRSTKLPESQEDDFRDRYGSLIGNKDIDARRAIMDSGVGARWKDNHIQIRDYISQRNWRDAYALAARHGISTENAQEYSAAEFLAGWLSLRYLNQPQRALAHFNNLYDNVKTPVSKSRGAYWLGRTYEALNNTTQAREWYEEGATYPTFFYGQLSIAKLYPKQPLQLPREPEVPASVRSAFDRRPLPHVVRTLAAMGEQDRATRFLRALSAGAETRADFLLTDDLARALGKPNLEVVVAKAANQKGFMLGQRGFPLTSMAQGSNPETALALGIIRQESEFKADAQSQVGALGMMQLMPATARSLANRAGVGFSERDLLNPSYNIKLGREYLGDRLDQFNGSYILSIASYNAGHGRVRQWLDIYGDPRSPSVDPIDWIETIPVYETRNYVQRVLENVQVYRSRLADAGGGTQPRLQIVDDLQR